MEAGVISPAVGIWPMMFQLAQRSTNYPENVDHRDFIHDSNVKVPDDKARLFVKLNLKLTDVSLIV